MHVQFPALLATLRTDHPHLTFTSKGVFCWLPKKREIQYDEQASGANACFALLHEVGHALLDHSHYSADFQLLDMEVAAWERAEQLAKRYLITIDEDHIQDCLDSYRDWIHRRSICPTCSTKSLQQDNSASYRCHNCHNTWQVASSRFCRPYRQVQTSEPTVTLL
jgi:NADH pyrophosphatase NudC (nudix superfamily)